MDELSIINFEDMLSIMPLNFTGVNIDLLKSTDFAIDSSMEYQYAWNDNNLKYLLKTIPIWIKETNSSQVKYGMTTIYNLGEKRYFREYVSNVGISCVPKMPLNYLKTLGGKMVADNSIYSEFVGGEYPQTEVDTVIQSQLNRLSQKGKLQGCETGKTYPICENIKGEGMIIIRHLKEYEYMGQKYVRMIKREIKSGCVVECSNEIKWYKVEPIEWIKLKNNTNEEYVISKNALFSGFPFDNQSDYDRDFENAYLYHFLNDEFKKAIVPTNQYYLSQNQSVAGNGYNFDSSKQFVNNENTIQKNASPINKKQRKLNNPHNFTYEELDNDAFLKAYVQAGQSVFLHGPSGVGKSARVKQLDPTATRITLRPQMNPEEIDGTLNRETGEYIPPLWYTQLCEKCKAEPDRKHILFIDELTNVKPTVQSLVYSIVLDRAGKDGLWPLPENAVVVGAGNENADNLAAYPMTNALYRRFCHINLKVDIVSWLDWASGIDGIKPIEEKKIEKSEEQARIHPVIYSYIMSRGEKVLNQELDEENPKIVTDPRKWEIASKVLYATKNPKALIPAIGEELTADLVNFTKQTHISIDDVLNQNYIEEDLLYSNFSERMSIIAGLTMASEEQLQKMRAFIGNYFGNEILATYDSMWVHNDPERAVILQECKDAMKIEKQKTKMQQSNIQDVMELIYDN